jgi:capsular exopolysaccharide synthesis family protein
LPSYPTTSQAAGGDDEIDLGDIGRTIVTQWRKIALLAFLTTLLAILFVFHSRPLFTVDGSLYLGDAQTSPGGGAAEAAGGLGFLSEFSSVSDVETQIELIRAKALIEQAVLETGLNAPVTATGDTNLRYWRWKLLHGGAIDAFAPHPGDIKALFATLAEPQAATALFDIRFGDDGHYDIYRPGGLLSKQSPVLSGVLGQPASGGGLSLELQPAVDGAVPANGVVMRLAVTSAQAVEEALTHGGILTVSAGGAATQPTKLANLTMVSENPYQAKAFLDQLMRDFIATQVEWKTQSASVTEDFISRQLKTITDQLDLSDRNLAAYQSQTGLLDVPSNAKAVIEQLSQYEVQRSTFQLQEEVLQQLADEIAHPAGDLNPYLVSQANDVVLGQLAGSLSSAEVELQALRVRFTGDAPEVQAAAASVARIEESIRTLVSNDLKLSADNLANSNRLIAQYEQQLRGMPAQSLRVITLERSSNVYGSLFVLLMQKKEEAEVSKAGTIINTRIVTPPELPLRATKPNASSAVLLGLFAGLFIGIAMALGARALSGKFQTDDEIRRAASLPLYGLIPRRSRAEGSVSVFSSRPQSPFAESFRLLRSNLAQSAPAERLRILLITSASAGDGKTTLSANLAKALADTGKSVLLIDADLHRGRLHTALNVPQAPGLTEWLVSGVRPPVQPVEDQRFSVMPNGILPPNPSELLNEADIGTKLATLRGTFDYVILDGPPLPAVSDAMSLGPHADVILSVVRVGRTKRRAFIVHNETVSALGVRQGMVINGVSGSGYGYGYGYGYGDSYGYGYSQAPDEKLSGVARLRRIIGRLWERLG